MNLVIVESPTKAKTLSRFLGKDFQAEATIGHIRDLPRNELGVDIEENFKPKYVVVKGRGKRIKELKAAARESQRVILATDPDREGEAIAWHTWEEIKRQKVKLKVPAERIVFHEITKEAVEEALKNPQVINAKLVDAQQARRVLDRLVGYQLSPLLWEKVRYGLSAGRVQSVAVRLVVERERERAAFVPVEHWELVAALFPQGREKEAFEAKLVKINGKDPEIKTEKEANKLAQILAKASWPVSDLDHQERKRSPYPPFTTTTLQRTAAAAFGFPAKKTMSLAQSLYERGLITYHRTDSTHLAQSAVQSLRRYIQSEFGDAYLPAKHQVYQTKVKVAQEAHEAIRPTKVTTLEARLTGKYVADAHKLYGLIWRNAVASQMEKAVFDQTRVEIEPETGEKTKYLFRATGSVLKFDGWLKVAGRAAAGRDRDKEGKEGQNNQKGVAREDVVLPELQKNEKLNLSSLLPSQHFSQPPPRYSEAALIKALEERGIGRPSTYAPILSTIQDRGYVKKEEKKLAPTATGEAVNDLLVEHFAKVVDYDFTAELEEELDDVARGERDWVRVIADFYQPFAKTLQKKFTEIKKEDVVVRRQLEEKCPECQSPLVVKLGRYGEFISCAAFPDCEFSRPLAEAKEKSGTEKEGTEVDDSQIKEPCPECGAKLVLKEGRFGKFIACSNYPKCKFTRNYQDKIGMGCPECGQGEVVRKKTRRGKLFFGCLRYPDCEWASWDNPQG